MPSLDRTVNGKVAATVIVVAGLVLPGYFFQGGAFENARLTPMAVLLPALYMIAVLGLARVALGKPRLSVTSEATDKRITNAYRRLQKTLTPLWWGLAVAWCIWVAYLVWGLYRDLHL